MGTGTPGREAAFPSSTRLKPRTACIEWGVLRRSSESGLACFLVRLGARFLVPACAAELASRAGAVKDARKRARQGLSWTAPSTAPGLGAVGTTEGLRRPHSRRADADSGTRRTLNPDVRGHRSTPRPNRRQHDGTLDRHRVKRRTLRSAYSQRYRRRPARVPTSMRTLCARYCCSCTAPDCVEGKLGVSRSKTSMFHNR